jgi:probable F420-dependent oxidoreductase
MRIGITAFLTDTSMAPHTLAVAVEERGFDALYLPEHTHMPVGQATPPGLVEGVHLEDYQRSLDPFASLAAAAVVTSRIALGTGVCLVAQHDPIVLAKLVATVDHLAGGRFVLGIGYGWNPVEAADHGIDFASRREVAREKMLCMRALWSRPEAEYHGRFVELPPSYSWPKPAQGPGVRTLVGGGAGPKLFAAIAEYADGWMPIGGRGVAEALPALRQAMSATGRDPDTLDVVPFGTVPDAGKLEHYSEIGCTEVVLRIESADGPTMLRALDNYTRFLPA